MKKTAFGRRKQRSALLLTTPALLLFWACQVESTQSGPGERETTTGSGGATAPNEPALTPLGGQLTTPVDYEPVAGSCGFESPAFCDTFEAGPRSIGVAGELDDTRWRAMRAMPRFTPISARLFPSDHPGSGLVAPTSKTRWFQRSRMPSSVIRSIQWRRDTC
jgi:hypothetical protein